jgi:hypothetical protein
VTRFDFAFDDRFRTFLMPLGVVPASAFAEVGREHFLVRFGPWSVTTRLDNITDASVSGPFSWWRVIGPRLSLSDRGLTFGSSTDKGVCLRFADPVRGLDPFGIVHHPGLTLTLADPGGFMNAIDDHAASSFQSVQIR